MTVGDLKRLLDPYDDESDVQVIDARGITSPVSPVLGESDIGEVVYVMIEWGMHLQPTQPSRTGSENK